MSKKVVTIPCSGRMVRPHSKKLEWELRNFVTSTGGSYYDDEILNGIIALYFKLANEICVEQKVRIRQKDYICHTTLSCYFDPNDKESLLKCVQLANAINCKLDYGNFEVCVETGEVMFKSVYEPDGFVCTDSLDKLIGYPRHIINQYGYMFLNLNK